MTMYSPQVGPDLSNQTPFTTPSDTVGTRGDEQTSSQYQQFVKNVIEAESPATQAQPTAATPVVEPGKAPVGRKDSECNIILIDKVKPQATADAQGGHATQSLVRKEARLSPQPLEQVTEAMPTQKLSLEPCSMERQVAKSSQPSNASPSPKLPSTNTGPHLQSQLSAVASSSPLQKPAQFNGTAQVLTEKTPARPHFASTPVMVPSLDFEFDFTSIQDDLRGVLPIQPQYLMIEEGSGEEQAKGEVLRGK
jgi:hypothetical protein